MSAPRKKKIYLAGPISGCAPDQIRGWRDALRSTWEKEFEFLDPSRDLVDRAQGHHAVVLRDIEAIESCDGVLANMWRESIGTSIGVVLAKLRNKPVVVANPSHLQSPLLFYYSDAVADTPRDGLKYLKDILARRSAEAQVLKRDNAREGFQVEKLSESLRNACRAAGRNDLLVPLEVVPRVLERLSGKHSFGLLPTKEIREAVWAVLAQFEAEPERHAAVQGVREAWQAYLDHSRDQARPRGVAHGAVLVHDRPLEVRVSTSKAHSSIWGRRVKSLADIPAPARAAFEHLCRAEGVAAIELHAMSKGGSQGAVLVQLELSRTPGQIEGACYDPQGSKGRVQHFRLRVHDRQRTAEICAALRRTLEREGLLKPVAR